MEIQSTTERDADVLKGVYTSAISRLPTIATECEDSGDLGCISSTFLAAISLGKKGERLMTRETSPVRVCDVSSKDGGGH